MMKKMIILTSEPKPEVRKKYKMMMMMMRNMVQIQGIQMTISHKDTHKNTAWTSTVIINTGRKNSKCRPKSDTQ